MSTSTETTAAPRILVAAGRPEHFLRRILARPIALIAVVLLALLTLVAVAAPWIVGDPNAFQAAARLQPPSPGHLFGTDNLGRDILTRVVFGAQASLTVGALTALIATAVGTVIGILASMFRIVDLVIMRIVDGLMSFPVIVLALALMSILGPSLSTVIMAMVTVFFPGVTRIVRGTALVVSELPMIDAARAVGAGTGRIFLRYVLPHCLTPILVQGAIVFTAAVLVESALSFIGAGLPPDVPSWGASLADARSYLNTAWWMWFFPAAALIITVLLVNVLIDTARDVLDPRHGSDR